MDTTHTYTCPSCDGQYTHDDGECLPDPLAPMPVQHPICGDCAMEIFQAKEELT